LGTGLLSGISKDGRRMVSDGTTIELRVALCLIAKPFNREIFILESPYFFIVYLIPNVLLYIINHNMVFTQV
jgi:hypothetical protein